MATAFYAAPSIARTAGYTRQIQRALTAILAESRRKGRNGAISPRTEEVQYQGRRLAKLGLSFDDVRRRLRRQCSANEAATLIEFHLSEAFHQVREAESRAFLQIFRAEVESADPVSVMQGTLNALLPYAQAAGGRVWLVDWSSGLWHCAASTPAGSARDAQTALSEEELLAPACLRGDSAAAEFDGEWSGQFATRWRIPLAAETELFGVIELGFEKDYEWLPREREVLLAAARLCALAIKRARLLDQLITVEEAERRRISRDLHDEAGQSLMYLRLQLEMLDRVLPENPDLRQKLVAARNSAEHAAEEIRRVLASLSPSALEQLGLCPALRQLLKRFRAMHQIAVRSSLPEKLVLPQKMEIVVYRIVQELLNNVAKHSEANEVKVRLEVADKQVRIAIEDNGKGFEENSSGPRRECFGLRGLRDRASLFGGTVQIRSKASTARRNVRRQAGASIRVELPLPAQILKD